MMRVLRKFAQTGFTLVELLIVVIILAILAAIVIPQYSSTANDAREAALDTNLAALRAAMELYRAEHGVYPGVNVATVGVCAPGSPGTGGANSAQAWMDQMLMASDADGHTCTLSSAPINRFGPYLRKGIPADPITGKGSAVADIVLTSTGAALAPAAATGGWAYDNVSGQIVMNSNAPDSSNNAYSTH